MPHSQADLEQYEALSAAAASGTTYEPLLGVSGEGAATAELDPETSTLVRTCDGTTVAEYHDGTIVTRHADGTTIRTSPSGVQSVGGAGSVMVEADGYASVTFDVGIDTTARAHSRGEKVPIAKGGERVRNRLAMPDGTRVVTTYNTKVTSKVRGKVAVVRPDLTEIVAEDSPVEPSLNTIQFRPKAIWTGGSVLYEEKTDPEPVSHPTAPPALTNLPTFLRRPAHPPVRSPARPPVRPSAPLS